MPSVTWEHHSRMFAACQQQALRSIWIFNGTFRDFSADDNSNMDCNLFIHCHAFCVAFNRVRRLAFIQSRYQREPEEDDYVSDDTVFTPHYVPTVVRPWSATSRGRDRGTAAADDLDVLAVCFLYAVLIDSKYITFNVEGNDTFENCP